MILGLYRRLTGVFAPVVQSYLGYRRKNGKESSDRFHERFGLPSAERPKGALVWFHAASVGEAISLLPLIESVSEDWTDIGLLLTTGTVTSADLMERRLPRNVIHQFVPVDLPKCVDRFIGYWQPDMAIWAESEIWPNLLQACKASGVEMVLVNGRMSERSFRRWSKLPKSAKQLFGVFDKVFGQTEGDINRLVQLGVSNASCAGNLKYAAPPLPVDTVELDRLSQAISGRPVWVAASTHPGEDISVARVHEAVKADIPNVLTLIAPRHVAKADEVEANLLENGLIVARRSRGELPDGHTDIYLCDTMGEMGLLYRSVSVAVIGKSWVEKGGQNPLEPARLGCAVLFGPYMENFASMASHMVKSGAAQQFADETEMGQHIRKLLEDSALCLKMAESGSKFAVAEAGSAKRIMQALQPRLDALVTKPMRP